MIFVTTGTQLPFPRLIKAINTLAEHIDENIVAQIGPDAALYPNLETVQYLSPEQFKDYFDTARVVVAHAGIGTILSAKSAQKALIILPRRHALGEHRNDHQVATARQVEKLIGVHIAWKETDLKHLLKEKKLTPTTPEPGPQVDSLIQKIKLFIDT